MTDLFDLTGKTAIVIGGSGGIGQVLALGLAQAGADVAVASRSLEKLQPVGDQISTLGRKTLAVSVDITQEQSVEKMINKVQEKFDRIDILVNCAGRSILNVPEKMPIEDWQKVMDINARGVFLSCQVVGRVMIKQGGGKIINISSVRGRYSADGAIAYGASKGAVEATTRYFAFEWARYKVFVNAIAPTVVVTELTRPLLSNPEKSRAILSRIPLGRLEEPEDIVGPTIFLASKASDFLTGQVIYVDGGVTIG